MILPSPILRLVHCSRNTIAAARPGVCLVDEVRSILALSRRNNRAAGVTGALLFTESAFVQALEGPPNEVEATFERIELDPRHAGVTILETEMTMERRFGEWSMGYCGKAALGQLAALGLDKSFAPLAPDGPNPVAALLYSLLETEADWAGSNWADTSAGMVAG